MIRCKDIDTTIEATLKQLAIERNSFAKSRQQWIHAAFKLAFHNNDEAFRKLVEEELCDKCKKIYEERSI